MASLEEVFPNWGTPERVPPAVPIGTCYYKIGKTEYPDIYYLVEYQMFVRGGVKFPSSIDNSYKKYWKEDVYDVISKLGHPVYFDDKDAVEYFSQFREKKERLTDAETSYKESRRRYEIAMDKYRIEREAKGDYFLN